MFLNKFTGAIALLALSSIAAAQEAALSYLASPAVYTLLGEDANFRVILATWQPGQKDVQHSHSAAVAYRLTDCTSRFFGADGKVLGEGSAKAGTTSLQGMIGSHSLQNTGTAECKVLLVERK
ncbi:MAG: hypothetical protein V4787_26965 [Pseudomonadota bacterium]